MKAPLLLCLILTTALATASKPAPAPADINAALQQAKTENKMLFLQFGRENCENCQALKGMIASKKVLLPKTKFVYADVNGDDPATQKVFMSKFRVIGDTFPFVVIASPEGAQLAARSGAGTENDYNNLIRAAQKKAAKK